MDTIARSGAEPITDDEGPFPPATGDWPPAHGGAWPAQNVLHSVPIRGEGNISWRRRRRRQPILQMPEMLIFTVALAAVLSLVVLVCNTINTRSFRPVPMLVFAAAGTYCVVLIRRRRALTAAEEALILELSRDAATEPPPRMLRKADRQALLNYFVYRPPSGAGQTQPVTPKREAHEAGADAAAGLAREREGEGGGGGEAKPGEVPPSDDDGDVGATSCTDEGLERRKGEETNGTERNSSTEGIGGDGSGGPGGDAEPGAGSERGVAVDEGDGSDKPSTGDAKKGGPWEWSTADSCIVCFGDYVYGENLCQLPCQHVYHAACIDEWLDGENHAWCPLCKRNLTLSQAGARAGGGGFETV